MKEQIEREREKYKTLTEISGGGEGVRERVREKEEEKDLQRADFSPTLCPLKTNTQFVCYF